MTAICAAFERHEIACATPVVLNSGLRGRAHHPPPVLTAVAQDQGVTLSWTAVTGATRYDVYQHRRRERRQLRQGQDRRGHGGTLTFLDAKNLQNGRRYFFNVLPVGSNNSCFGRMSNSATAVSGRGTEPVPFRPR